MSELFETSLRETLLADETIQGLIGEELYPLELPEYQQKFPVMTYFLAARQQEPRLNARDGKQERVYTFTVWSPTYEEAKQGAEILFSALDTQKRPYGGFTQTFSRLVDQRDVRDSAAKLYGVESDYHFVLIEPARR